MAALRLPCAVFRFPAWRLYRHLAKPSLAERLPHGMRRIHRPLGGVSVVCTNEWLSAVAVDAAAHRCFESVRRHSGFKPWTLSCIRAVKFFLVRRREASWRTKWTGTRLHSGDYYTCSDYCTMYRCICSYARVCMSLYLYILCACCEHG